MRVAKTEQLKKEM